MTLRNISRAFGAVFGAASLVLVMLFVPQSPAQADIPQPQASEPFNADECAGTTWYTPTENVGYAVVDTTLIFGERLVSYNSGYIVPLYDAFGGTILIDSHGVASIDDVTGEPTNVAYPPLCGARYVEELDATVSEWMFCTDRKSQSCGDTDGAGNLVDHRGDPINPMTGLPGNERLDANQEKLIAYLIQHGHPYTGTGDFVWDDAGVARSDLDSNERAALQTLIWCISDPVEVEPDEAADDYDFYITCEANVGELEQERLLALIPDDPTLHLDLDTASQELSPGDTARFTLDTNVFNQPIATAIGGTATATWEVCEGSASWATDVLTVTGSDPSVSQSVTLCATASSTGTVTLAVSASPPSLTHIGWSQSINNFDEDEPPCQVYATFHQVLQATMSAEAQAAFGTPSAPTPTDDEPVIAATGAADSPIPLIAGLVLLGVGVAAGITGLVRARRKAVVPETEER